MAASGVEGLIFISSCAWFHPHSSIPLAMCGSCFFLLFGFGVRISNDAIISYGAKSTVTFALALHCLVHLETLVQAQNPKP